MARSRIIVAALASVGILALVAALAWWLFFAEPNDAEPAAMAAAIAEPARSPVLVQYVGHVKAFEYVNNLYTPGEVTVESVTILSLERPSDSELQGDPARAFRAVARVQGTVITPDPSGGKLPPQPFSFDFPFWLYPRGPSGWEAKLARSIAVY